VSRSGLRRVAALVAAAGGVLLLGWLWRVSDRVATPPSSSRTPNVLLVTIDTLRADRVGAYGASTARTTTLDSLARAGTRFDRAFAVAPITLPSHASLLSGLYPPGHGARHNGMRVRDGVPTLATVLRAGGYATGAFVSAFPLDARFGLGAGFDAYDDRLPRNEDGRPANERPARATVDAALAWHASIDPNRAFFLWVHLFEPHAPYDPEPGVASGGTLAARYDAEVTVADRETGRLLARVDPDSTAVVVVAGDHGEAFGEHGEVGHSIFVYDTTLRVPLIVRAPGMAPDVVTAAVTLADVAPTLLRLAGQEGFDSDGVALVSAMRGADLAARELYAESFAPLVDFGWSPLRSLRTGPWKFIEAPRPELFQMPDDPGETRDRAAEQRVLVAGLHERLSRYGTATLPPAPVGTSEQDRASVRRLRALGYASGSAAPPGGSRADPKDRRELAAAIGHVTSGELTGQPLVTALERILAEDPQNPQAHLRLGVELTAGGRCETAAPHLEAAIRSVPSADPYLALAGCHVAAGRLEDAERILERARAVERDNPVVIANLAGIDLERGRPAAAITRLQAALALDPDLHQARFNLARALARAGRRTEAASEARVLLERLPSSAPQRAEVQRLVQALQ
jgi:arylsulfatase A-like enzyme/cytochrome c-type biogenesis protein CcmH/NrfG